MKILVTGGNGFIGSNFIELVLKNSEDVFVVNIDSSTYAGQGNNLEHMDLDKNERYKSYDADITNKKLIDEIFQKERPEVVVNFAAESHVDRSITEPETFIQTNVLGTFNLLEAARRLDLKKFIQISTDEVYGSLSNESPMSKEGDLLKPRSPYSASKAAAEQIALSYFHTYGLPVIISRSSNNYGPYQFPEKLIPLFVTNLIEDKKVTLMYSAENPGLNVRDWLYVKDNCQAIWELIEKGEAGEIYNISGNNEKTNVEITETILSSFGVGKEMVEYIPHRKGHDFRYAIDDSKLKSLVPELRVRDFSEAMKETVNWYKANENWWRAIKK
jgi:dTDP-glucose 4,6-dehydratase